jgi:hydrophobe/amphiphile efflux-3 (HAE3) family protein
VSPLTLASAGPLPEGVSLDQPGVATSIMFGEDGKPNAAFARFFPSGNMLVQVTPAANVSVDGWGSLTTHVQDEIKAVGLPNSTVVAGYPRLFSELPSTVMHDMAVTGLVAILLMIVVLYIVFPVRRRLLALPVVLVGVLFTFGITGALGVSLTIVTMAGLPILLGLGMDFAIQFHNRYEEELARGETPAAGLIDALTHIGPAVGAAVLATILGFMTLSLSSVPAIRDFVTLLALGVAILFVVALVALNALLYRFDKEPSVAEVAASSAPAADVLAKAPARKPRLDIGRYLAALASFSVRRGPIVVAVAALLAMGGLAADHLVPIQTDIEKLMPADAHGLVAMNQVSQATGSSTPIQFLVTAPDVTSPAVLGWMADFETREMKAHSEIVDVTSLPVALGLEPGAAAPTQAAISKAIAQIPAPIRSSLISDDHRSAAVTFDVKEMSIAQVADLIKTMQGEANAPAGVSIVPAGTVDLAASVVSSVTDHRLEITLAGFLAVFLGLLVVYRNWRRAITPVVPIILVTGWSSGAMWLLGMELNPLTAVMSALIVGIGTEFAVLLLERYWEELGRGVSPQEAMNQAVSRIGRAIAASGLTVTAGFAALLASSFPAIGEFGAVTVIDVLLALVATIVVVPPLALWLIRRRQSPAPVAFDANSSGLPAAWS